MEFELSVFIDRPPMDVFAFLRDKDQFPQAEDSPVLSLEKLTDGSPGVGTRYVEVVQMLPGVRGEIRSVITRFDPPEILAESFQGAGMEGHVAYQFKAEGEGTRMFHRETLRARGTLQPLSPFIKRMRSQKLEERLRAIKAVLEGGWQVSVEWHEPQQEQEQWGWGSED